MRNISKLRFLGSKIYRNKNFSKQFLEREKTETFEEKNFVSGVFAPLFSEEKMIQGENKYNKQKGMK